MFRATFYTSNNSQMLGELQQAEEKISLSLHKRRRLVFDDLFNNEQDKLNTLFSKEKKDENAAINENEKLLENLDEINQEEWEKKLQSLSDSDNEFFNLIKEYIDLINEDKKEDTPGLNILGDKNHQLHLIALRIATVISIGELTAEYGHAFEILNAPNLAYLGLPVVIATLALGGAIDTVKALFNSEMENRLLIGIEGLNRAATGSVVFALQQGLLQTSAFTINGVASAVPFLFALIVMGMIAKETYLLNQTQTKIKTLEDEMKHDESELEKRIVFLKNVDIKKDVIVQQLSLKLTDSTIKLNALKEQEKTQIATIRLMSTIGLLSVALFALAGTAFGGPAFVVAALLLFVVMNLLIKKIKAREKENVDNFKKDKPIGIIQGDILRKYMKIDENSEVNEDKSINISQQNPIQITTTTATESTNTKKSLSKTWATQFNKNKSEMAESLKNIPKKHNPTVSYGQTMGSLISFSR